MTDQPYKDALASLAAASRLAGKLTRERNAALATIARVEALAARWWDHPDSEGQLDAAAELRVALAEPKP